MDSILLLLPDFALILLGFSLRRGMQLGDHFWTGLEKLVYFVLFPALLFSALVRTHIDFAGAAPFLGVAAAATGAGMLLALLVPAIFPLPSAVFASRFQCAFRFNSYLGLAVAGKLHGAAGIAAMGILVGAIVPVVNAASVWMLARHGKLGIWREIARNPLIVATGLGLIFNAAGWVVPAVVLQFLGRLSEASIALGLLAVGAALKLRGEAGSHGADAYLLAVKLIAVPVAAWAGTTAIGLEGVYRDIAVVFAALPTASSAYILAMRMGGDGPGVAWLISASTLLAMGTLPLWLNLLGR